jgi:adenylyltransferase/sulfurtransferase
MIAGIGEPLVGRLLLYDALRMRFREISLPRDRDCPVCGDAPTILEPVQYEDACEPESPAQITAAELRRWRADGAPHTLVDVREPSEHASANIPGAMLIPLGDLAGRLDVLPRDRPIVVHCRSGGRSSRAVEQLRGRGYDARNLVGGMNAWLRGQPALTDK